MPTVEVMLRVRVLLSLLLLLLVVHAPTTASAAGPLGRFPAGFPLGIFSVEGDAARERAQAGFGLRTVYVTSGVGDGHRHDAGAPRGRWLTEYLAEARAVQQVPILSYYQVQSSTTRGSSERGRFAAGLRSKELMRRYWRDVRAVLQRAGGERRQLVVLQVEPDGWQYLEQLQGSRTRAMVGATGMAELRGLPNDARGFARAFARLRDLYAPNVALAFHLSPWGTGQLPEESVENSRQVGRLRARFVRALGARFDLATTDPQADSSGTDFDAASFPAHLTLVQTFHDDAGLPLIVWQVHTRGGVVPWFLDGSPAARERLRQEREAGVIGMTFDAGTPADPSTERVELFAGALRARAAGLLG